MKFALFARPVVTIYDLPTTTKESEAGIVSTIGDEGLYGQACQVRTAPGGVTAEGEKLPDGVAEVVTFYGYHGYVFEPDLYFMEESDLRAYLGAVCTSVSGLQPSASASASSKLRPASCVNTAVIG